MVQFRKNAIALVQENDARRLGRALGVEPPHVAHEVGDVAGHLHAAEAAADDDHGEQPLSFVRVGLDRCGLEVANEVVPITIVSPTEFSE
jgi:hypothetical protein